MMTAAREILEARIKSRIISSQIQTPSWHWTVGIVLNNYILLFIVERRNVIGQLLTTVHELLWQGSHTRFNWDKRIDTKKRHPIWDVITHPCPNIFAKSLRVGAWMDNYIPLFYADVITFPCFNLALLAKGSPEDFAEIESDPGIYTQVSVKFLSVYLNERIHPGDYELDHVIKMPFSTVLMVSWNPSTRKALWFSTSTKTQLCKKFLVIIYQIVGITHIYRMWLLFEANVLA